MDGVGIDGKKSMKWFFDLETREMIMNKNLKKILN